MEKRSRMRDKQKQLIYSPFAIMHPHLCVVPHLGLLRLGRGSGNEASQPKATGKNG